MNHLFAPLCSILVSEGCNKKKLAQTGWLKITESIHFQLWRPEVQSQGVVRAILLLEALGEDWLHLQLLEALGEDWLHFQLLVAVSFPWLVSASLNAASIPTSSPLFCRCYLLWPFSWRMLMTPLRAHSDSPQFQIIYLITSVKILFPNKKTSSSH